VKNILDHWSLHKIVIWDVEFRDTNFHVLDSVIVSQTNLKHLELELRAGNKSLPPQLKCVFSVHMTSTYLAALVSLLKVLSISAP